MKGYRSMGPSRLATSAHGSLPKGFGGEGAGVGPSAFAGPWVAGEWLLLHGPSRRDPSPWVLQGWPLPHTDPCPKDLEARVPVSDPQPLREPWAGEWLLLQGLSRRDPSAVVDLPDRARGPRRVLPAGRAEVALDPQGRASREPLLVQGPCMASRRDPSALQGASAGVASRTG